ncbi:hypothetical protein NKR19_g5941 [Coniochaeta hoffmannii]|uniref:Uncharacterized protein n=1 Tax=Coniochaeta hoffmannii TaxID=91930 RepID=A0AA38VFG4_9PEZI|nr:hypothetical protein NKR19_g5941 [Coniochaeta hoffmannii]
MKRCRRFADTTQNSTITSKPRPGQQPKQLNIGHAATYLILLEGPFESVEEVRIAARPNNPPEMVTGIAVPGDVTCFCRIDEKAKAAIVNHLIEKRSSYRPTFLQITQAAKALSDMSSAPFQEEI